MNMRIASAALAIVAATTLVAGAVSPAAAAINDPSKPAAKQEVSVPDAKSDKRTYCIDTNVTGSRITKRECHKRAEWIALTGLDPVTAQK